MPPDRPWALPTSSSVDTEAFPSGVSCWSVKLTTHVHLVPKLRMSGAMPLPPTERNSYIYRLFFKERFIAPINIKTYTKVTKLFLNYNQFTTVS
jgi:hypothetical protein